MSVKGKAVVAHATLQDGGWKMEDVTVRALEHGELLVKMVGTGVCHTDIMIGGLPAGQSSLASYPRVLGHEGSGYVEQVGPGVFQVQVGDPVLCSYSGCLNCEICKKGSLSHCIAFNDINIAGTAGVFRLATKSGEHDINGLFFGQSSFAEYSIVKATSVVNVKDLVLSREELQLFSPLGCGIQTGAGTAINVAQAKPEDVVCVTGLGGVGLSAVMGAKLQGSRIIIGVDRVESRLQLAMEMGCTHVINSSNLAEGKSLTSTLQEIADGVGPTITIETSGAPILIEAGLQFTRNVGTHIQIGSPPFNYQLSSLNLFKMMSRGLRIVGAVEGQVIPSVFVPKMIEWYRAGKFPFDKMIKTLPASEWEKAVHGMHDGSIIKPVLVWD